MNRWTRFGSLLLAYVVAVPCVAAEPYFVIRVVDEATGRGVPLVELKTVNEIRLVTDSNGIVAFHEPGLMDRDVFFHVSSHGYEFPKDGFGFAGKSLKTTPGGKATLKLRRINVAERLYRITGGGIYRDSLLAGEAVPFRMPSLNADVLGSDSVLNAVHRGRIYWFWGDTNRPGYPLGNFHAPGATSELPDGERFDPDLGIELNYFTGADGFAKETAKMPGSGPTWIEALVSWKEPAGERMFAAYGKVKPPLTIYERGLAEWDDELKSFRQVAVFPPDAPLVPTGHTFLRTTNGVEHVYFAAPYPLLRVRATSEELRDPSRYESYSCLKSGSRLSHPELDRDGTGRARYSWKRDAPLVGPEEQRKLVTGGTLKAEEALLRLADRDTGKPVSAHRGSVYWNDYRKRWVMIAVQSLGTSVLGEVWYSEADTPEGPWAYAVKVVTHDRYSFYNPKQHPMFDRREGRIIYFEGTYTRTFSGNPEATPRYDYNQLLYRLDLTDARLALPAAFAISDDGRPRRLGEADLATERSVWGDVAFLALDRPGAATTPVFADELAPGKFRLRLGAGTKSDSTPAFHAYAPGDGTRPKSATPLWEFRDDDGNYRYSVESDWSRPGFKRLETPVCEVWATPDAAVPPDRSR